MLNNLDLRMKKIKQKYLLYILCFCILNISSCASGDNGSSSKMEQNDQIIYASDTAKPIKKITFRFYIDNSASMKGFYTADPSNFLKNLNAAITYVATACVQNNYDCEIYTFDDSIRLLEKVDVNNVGKTLEHLNFRQSLSGKSTDIKDVLVNLIDDLNEDEVNLIFTDAIPSPTQKDEPIDKFLDVMKNSIFRSVHRKMSQYQFAGVYALCDGNFDGYFYDQHDVPYQCKKVTVPYFIWCFGNNEVIKSMAGQLIYQKGNAGIEAKNVILRYDFTKIKTNVKLVMGQDYEINGNATDLSLIKKKNTKSLLVNLLADFKEIPLDPELLKRPDYYEIFVAGNLVKEAKIEVKPIENLSDPANAGFTHKVRFSVPDTYGSNAIEMHLKFKNPPWLDSLCTTENLYPGHPDFGKKIFGYQSILMGFREAYRSLGLYQDYLNVKIGVKY